MKWIKEFTKQTRKHHRTPDALRLLAFADLHWVSEEEKRILKNIKVLESDVIILLGDIDKEEAYIIASCAGEIPVLAVLGNHNKWGQYNDIPNIITLDGNAFQYNNTTFAGISGSIGYKADTERCMRTQEEFLSMMDKLPKADILISHDGPYHLLSKNKSHEGIRGISHYIKKYRPSLSIFGHQHEEFEGIIGKTNCICVYRCAIIDANNGTVSKIF